MKTKSVSNLLAACAVAASTGVYAHTLDLNLNNDAVALDYNTQIDKSELNVGAGLLHNQDTGDVFYGSFFVADNVNKQSGLLAGIGGRAYFIDADRTRESGTAVGIGGFLNWEIPSVTNLSVRSDLYYAPDVLSFDEIDGYVDFSARLQYRVIEQAWLYIGYRNTEAKTQSPGKAKIDEGGHLGVMIWF